MRTRRPQVRMAIFLCVTIVASFAASAQVSDTPLRTSRELRSEAVLSRPLAQIAPAAATPWRFSAGVFGDRDQYRTRTVGTPFALSYVSAVGWRLQLLGDGYTRIKAPGQGTVDGLGDLGINVYHPLTDGLTGAVGLGIPVGGDVGSRKLSQKGKLSYAKSLDSGWSLYLQGSVSHVDRKRAGVSDWSQGLYVEGSYELSAAHSVGLGIARGHTRGVAGATELSGYYSASLSPTQTGTVSLGRGVTSGSRHTSIGLDYAVKY